MSIQDIKEMLKDRYIKALLLTLTFVVIIGLIAVYFFLNGEIAFWRILASVAIVIGVIGFVASKDKGDCIGS